MGDEIAGVPAGEARINFAAHQVRTGVQGAREDFEVMISQLVRAVRPGARMIAANPGDWGIDVLVGHLGDTVIVWQSKYFMPQVTKSHHASIRKSFDSVAKNAAAYGFKLAQWILCVPSSMDGPTARWWDDWKRQKEREFDLMIELWDETELRGLLITAAAEPVRRHFYEPAGTPLPQAGVDLAVRGKPMEGAATDSQEFCETTASSPVLPRTSNQSTGSTVGGFVQAHHVGSVSFGFIPETRLAVPKQLPPPPKRLVYRDDLLEELNQLVDAHVGSNRPMVAVLSGISGVGKSAGAFAWAQGNLHRFTDGQLYADLADYRDRGGVDVSEVLAGFLQALGVLAPPSRLSERAALFRTMTADARVLVVLDDVDQAAQVRPCIPNSVQGAVIVTSRSRLSGLAMDGAAMIEIEPLGVPESVALLRELLPAGRNAADEELRELATLCDGLPIGLVVIGALLGKPRHWPPLRLVEYLSDERWRLHRLALPGTRQFQSLFDAVASQLSDIGRRIYHVVGLHPGPDFGPHVMVAATGIRHDDVEDAVDELCEVNLVRSTGCDRYRMHSLIKLHSRNAFEHNRHPTDVLWDMVEWYRVTAAAADRAVLGDTRWRLASLDSAGAPFSFDAATAMEWFEIERANLLAAVRTAARRGWDDHVWQLCESLWASYHSKKHYADSIAAHELAVTASRRCSNGVAEVRMLNQLARARIEIGEFDSAGETLYLARQAAESCGDVRAQAVVLESLGVLHRTRGGLEESETYFRASLALNEQIGDDRGVGLQCYHLGDVLLRLDDPITATELLLRAVDVLAAMGDVLAVARAEIVLGSAYAATHKDDHAREVLLSAVRAMRALEQHAKESQALQVLIEVARRRDETDLIEETLARLVELSGSVENALP